MSVFSKCFCHPFSKVGNNTGKLLYLGSSKKLSFCVAKVSMRWQSALQNMSHKISCQMKSLQMFIAWLGSGWQRLDLASYRKS